MPPTNNPALQQPDVAIKSSDAASTDDNTMVTADDTAENIINPRAAAPPSTTMERNPARSLASSILQDSKSRLAFPGMKPSDAGNATAAATPAPAPATEQALAGDSQHGSSAPQKGLRGNSATTPGAVSVVSKDATKSATSLSGTTVQRLSDLKKSDKSEDGTPQYADQVDHRKATYLAYSSNSFRDGEHDDDDDDDDVEAPAPARPAADQRPGAYTAQPGVDYERLASLRGVQMGVEGMADTSEPVSPLPALGEEEAFVEDAEAPNIEVSAVRVDEDELELNIREEIANNAAQAEIVDLEEENREMRGKIQRKYVGVIAVLVVLVIIVLVVVLTQVTGNNGAAAGNVTVLPDLDDLPVIPTTLKTVANNSQLRCGVSRRTGDEDDEYDMEFERNLMGFHADLCKAVAAAANLDPEANVTFHEIGDDDKYKALQNGTLDMLILSKPSSSEKLFFDNQESAAVTFTAPVFFDGAGVGGLPQYVEKCALEEGIQSVKECNSVKFCATIGSHSFSMLEEILHTTQLIGVASLQQLYTQFAEGCCNLIATDFSDQRAEVTVRNQTGYQGPYQVGTTLYTRQPFAIATRKAQIEDDLNGTYQVPPIEEEPQVWSKFVDWTLQALIAAEQRNITKNVSHLFPPTDVFGVSYQHCYRRAVASVGNYGEIYERNLGAVIPRFGMNLVVDGSTGLHNHESVGGVLNYGQALEHETLSAIRERGKLICGIPQRLGEETSSFSVDIILGGRQHANGTTSGSQIDMDFCKALASSVFQGLPIPSQGSGTCLASENVTTATPSDGRIEFVLLSDTRDGYVKLNSGDLDVIAGFRKTIQDDVREPTTGKGYSFSQPYFFGDFFGATPDAADVSIHNRCLVTREDDTEWSDFVHVAVSSIFYAEVEGITQQTANAMPTVNRFGPTYELMLRDCVFSIGHYGETHDRSGMNRSSVNELNRGGSPQMYAFPGLF